ncbi:MAG: hypothetical protein JW791_02605 [Nanoarchaeota archaeon]|nr:hypothetical protein [Nanoarchaeota archaeon]
MTIIRESNFSDSLNNFNVLEALDEFVYQVAAKPVEYHREYCLESFVERELFDLNLQEMYRDIKIHYMIKEYLYYKKLLTEEVKNNKKGYLDFILRIDVESYESVKDSLVGDFLEVNLFELEEVMSKDFEPGDLIKQGWKCFIFDKVLSILEKQTKNSILEDEVVKFVEDNGLKNAEPQSIAWTYAIESYKIEEKRWKVSG